MKIESHDRSAARVMEKIRLKARKKYGKKTKFDQGQWDFVGSLGELMIAKLMNLDPDFNEYSGSDLYDFKLPNGRRVDVKTGHFTQGAIDSLPESYKFLIPIKQICKPVDIFISVQLDPEFQNAYIMGWISKYEARQYPTRIIKGNTAVVIPFKDLNPISHLI